MSIFSLVKGGKEHGVFEMRMLGGEVLNSYKYTNKKGVTISPPPNTAIPSITAVNEQDKRHSKHIESTLSGIPVFPYRARLESTLIRQSPAVRFQFHIRQI